GPGGPTGAPSGVQTAKSPAKSTLGRRKHREADVFGQLEEQEPRTPTRPRKLPEPGLADIQMEMESEQEERTTAEAEAIVIYQLETLRRELQGFSDHHVWGSRALDSAYEIARKFMPELIEAGEKQQADGNADSARALQETAELRSTVKEIAKAVAHLTARQGSIPETDGLNNRGTPEVAGTKSVMATGPTYRPTRAGSAQAQATAQRRHIGPRSPKDQYHPARLIVIPRGEKFDAKRMSPRQLVNLINDRLSRSNEAKHLCVASAHYNYNQNLVIMMREDQKGEELRQHAGIFADVFGVPAHTIEMITDDRRYKVRINGVWTGRDGEDSIHTPDDLLEEIERFNPVLSKVKLIGKPRWLRAEADLRQKDYSSVVLEFAKEDDAKMVLATRYIAMYTNFCEVVHHADRPPVLQCSNCWTLGHHVSRCKQPTKCRLCAGNHNETEHRREENQNMGQEMEGDGGEKERQAKCANCSGNHPATERNCPERKRYQMLAREKEEGGIEGGKTVRRKAGGKKKPTTTTTTTTTRITEEARTGAAEDAQRYRETATTNEETNKNTNRFMALENLLNEYEEAPGRWADEEMEGQEETEKTPNGNVPPL
ncbi:hypothetical protein C0993_006545, partial [Termitomyces sp. T159_Od127]